MKFNNAVINPDNYLETPSGRVWSPSRSKIAWQQAYDDFERVVNTMSDQYSEGINVYVVIGIQGAGKSSWIRDNQKITTQPTVYFDAALPAIKHRQRILEIAKKHSNTITAVWLNTPLKIALLRNARRSLDTQVPENAIISVFKQLIPPTKNEGFSDIVVVTHG